MSEIFHELVFHLVFATKDRAPLFTPPIQRLLFSQFRQACETLHGDLHEIGGTEDHVHVLISLRPSHRLDVVVDNLKSAGAEMI
ncbi:MAG: IS200/IS605 family transposase, partial [bacterium]